MGLKKIHSFTQQGAYVLRVDLEDWKEGNHWAEYSFTLEGPSMGYSLYVSNYSGDLPDAMANSTGMRFSTTDRNNENHRNSNCSRSYTGKHSTKLNQKLCFGSKECCSNTYGSCPDPLAGGWWFNACRETNLNGRYLWLRAKGRSMRRKGIHWKPGTGPSYSLKTTKMTLRSAPTADSFK